jgi:hypothetical protein
MRLTLLIALAGAFACLPLGADLADAERTNPDDPAAADAGAVPTTCTANGKLDEGEECDPEVAGGPVCKADCTLPRCKSDLTCDDGSLNCVSIATNGNYISACMRRVRGFSWSLSDLQSHLSVCLKHRNDGPPEIGGPCTTRNECEEEHGAGFSCVGPEQEEINLLADQLHNVCLLGWTINSSNQELDAEGALVLGDRALGVLVDDPNGGWRCVREGCTENQIDFCDALAEVVDPGGDSQEGARYCNADSGCAWRECDADADDSYCVKAHRIDTAVCDRDWCMAEMHNDVFYLDHMKSMGVHPAMGLSCDASRCGGDGQVGSACTINNSEEGGPLICATCDGVQCASNLDSAGFLCINGACQLPCGEAYELCVGDSECRQIPAPPGGGGAPQVCAGFGRGFNEGSNRQCNPNDPDPCPGMDGANCSERPLIARGGNDVSVGLNVFTCQDQNCDPQASSDQSACLFGQICADDGDGVDVCVPAPMCAAQGFVCPDQASCNSGLLPKKVCHVVTGNCSSDEGCFSGMKCDRSGESPVCVCGNDGDCGDPLTGMCRFGFCFVSTDSNSCPVVSDHDTRGPFTGLCVAQ